MENFGSAAQLFPASCSSCWVYEKFGGLSFQWSGFSSFPASSKFPKFSSLWFSFSSRHSCYSCSFSSFLVSTLMCRHRCSRTSRYGLVMKLCATGKIWKLWYLLDELSNSGRIVKFWKKNCQILENLKIKI